MKKVLIGLILDGLGGGVDKYILNFCDAVRSPDVQIDLLTNKIHEDLKNTLSEKNSQLFEIASLTQPKTQYRQVKTLVEKYGYDTVYFCYSTAIGYMAVKGARDGGAKKVIVHSHNSGYDDLSALKRALMTALHSFGKHKIAQYATDFLACSDKAAQWLFPNSILQEGKVVYVQNTIDTDAFYFSGQKRDNLREALGCRNRFVIGHVGNFFYQKNHTFLMDIFAKIHQLEPNAMLLLLGDGPLLPAMQEKVKQLHLEENVLFLGKRPSSDGYMSAFDVFVLPSNFEGMPIVSVEAQCAGLPCVFSAAITEEAQISRDVTFLPLGDAVQWAEEILRYKAHVRQATPQLTKPLDTFSLSGQKEFLSSLI